ncbi:MAG: hypothetical protein OXG61_09495 [Chloroflexi bacterium]|nr:hypothetical protein [Chloroflexota bacterium]
MTGIWTKVGDKWNLATASDYENEQELHDRIVAAPEMLPLSGQPVIVAPYQEVPLGGGSADVLAFEANGRPVVIEVKLSKNPEAKRAVVAQTLAYAAWLHGTTVEALETRILASHLSKNDHGKLSDAIEEHGIDDAAFYQSLEQHLDRGSFRLVIVLDDAPAQLVRLMGYLETITTDQITVDLVTVTAYEVNGAQVLLPQRVDPERVPALALARPPASRRSNTVQTTEGSAAFRDAIDRLGDGELARRLRQYVQWAEQLEAEDLCRLDTGEGTARYSLRLRLVGMNTTIVALVLPKEPPEEHHFWIQIGVARREAPNALPYLIKAGGLDETKQAGSPAAITDELLDALARAYREAAGKE